ncbi:MULTISPECIES: hypothetical protein [unclassified Lysobacter]|uniref:hypothetical protein n=1 Tax=unclassified Lysobacter TaxID=2635362 RepID=UPI0006FA3D80|nr:MULTISPECIES: hypothetical protein [unclassified Lysobacter]KQZ56926.1 hypothetical protein ASD53_10565 [Lysobacter sp. Root559]KRC34770.1 hypothetical protein ASE10_08720 [Lysobacter sp. Root76]KRD70459.1 hypothetical protein ASE45_00890 [Lysobacter sp. Root96]
MALVPKIDSPCPLGIDELRRLQGYCGHCGTNVHALDSMDEQERKALLRAAAGPICVSYRVPRPASARRGAGFGIAIAATLVSGGAFAGGAPAADPPSLLAPATTTGPVTSPVAVAPLLPSQAATEGEKSAELEFVTVVGGGVRNPQDAQWIDDSDLPELPMRDAASPDAAPTRVDAADGVSRPAH